MDDMLDALVGDVSQLDQDEYHITKREDGGWLADAQYPYFELLNYFGMTDEEKEGDFATIAGLILHLTGRIPSAGDKIEWKGFYIEVVDMDGLRIDKVLITPKED
jgi:putative hemolysin